MFRRATSSLILAVFLASALVSSFGQKSSSAESPLAVARTQIAKNELETAERTLWTVISSDPNNTEALVLLGTVRLRQQRYAEAEALFRRVVQLDPHSVEGQKSLGLVLLSENKFDEAAEKFQAVAKEAPNDYEVKLKLARLYVSARKFAEAVAVLDSIPAAKFPASAIPVKASALLGTGRMQDAAALIIPAAKSTNTGLDLAEVFIASGQPYLALRTLAQLPKGSKQPARFYYLKGSAERQKGDVASAAQSFNQAIMLDPKSAPTLVAMAEIAATRKRYKDSVALLERANAADPNDVSVLRHLVEQAMNAGLHGLVEKTAFELEKKSSEPDDQYLAAAALLQEREYEEAGRIFAAYVAQRPQDSKAFLGLGLAYLNQQKYPDAEKALGRSLELDPKLTEAEYSLGVLCLKEGDNERALQYFQRVLKSQPSHAKALLEAGTLYLQSGELDKATASLQASEAVDPNDPNTQYQLSLLYNRTGKAEEARKHMDNFRALKQKTGGVPQAAQ